MPKGIKGFQKGHPSYLKDFSEATKKKLSIAKSGKNNPMYGVHRLGKDASRWKGGPVKRICLYCGGEFWCKRGSNQKYCSKKCAFKSPYRKKYPSHFGKNASNWQGGLTSLTQRIRHLPEYFQWRLDVFQKDDYTCQRCSARSGNGKAVYLEAHHTPKTFAEILSEFLEEYNQFSPYDDKDTLVRLAMKYEPFWDINGGETLCEKCHDLTKKGRRKNEV